MFDGDVALANIGVSFYTTALGNGQYDFHSGFKVGQYKPEFVLSKPGHPLDGFKVNKIITFYGADVRGAYGALVYNDRRPLFNNTFNFSAGNDLYCRSGVVVDALGVSSSYYVGGTGGVERTLKVGKQIKQLHIRVADYEFVNDPKKVISYFGAVNTSGVEVGCGTTGNHNWLKNPVDYRIDIPSNEKLTEVTVYSTGMTGYIHGILVATEKVD